jgi:hypothetical protein
MLKAFAIAFAALCFLAFVAIIAANVLSSDAANKPVQPNKNDEK